MYCVYTSSFDILPMQPSYFSCTDATNMRSFFGGEIAPVLCLCSIQTRDYFMQDQISMAGEDWAMDNVQTFETESNTEQVRSLNQNHPKRMKHL